MRPFMNYLEQAFYTSSNWDPDNSYSSLTTTSQALLFFDTPKGLRLNVSSLPSPNFAHTYSLGTVGLVEGALSYLYTSLPITQTPRSVATDLRDVVEGYRFVQELRKPEEVWTSSQWQRALDGRKDTLLYGRLDLPRPTLEALYMRRISPTTQLRLTCVSHSDIMKGASMLALVQRDVGKHSTEYLYSTDSALLGFRGLYNFGPDPRQNSGGDGEGVSDDVETKSVSSALPPPTSDGLPPPLSQPEQQQQEQLAGRFSAGAEIYYGLMNKTAGMSTGLRFTTLPRHTGFPYTMTATLNPLMGNLSSTYSVKAGRNISLCSQLDFNFYSYESDFRLGCEIWRRNERKNVEWAERKAQAWRDNKSVRPDEDVSGVLKLRCDQRWNVGVLWEGRIKELLFSSGVSLDFHRREQIFKAFGVEIRYSS